MFTSARRSRPLHRVLLAGTVVTALTLLTACDSAAGGGSGEVNKAGLATAQKNLDTYSAEPQFRAQYTSINVASLKGKTIFNIPNNSQVPFNIAQDTEMEKVAKAQGLNFTEFNNNGTPTEWSAGIGQAIAQKASVIMLGNGTDPTVVLPALRNAKAAGIPVISLHNYTESQTPPSSLDGLLYGFTRGPFELGTKLVADYIAVKSGGKAQILQIKSSDLSPDDPMTAALASELKDVCPGCTVKDIDIPVTSWAQQIPAQVQTALTANPGIDWIAAHYDAQGSLAITGVKQAGKTKQVKVASFNGNLAPLKQIQDGDVFTMDVGEDVTWISWANVDLAFRAILGAQTAPDNNPLTPTRVFDASNISEVGTPPEFGKGYGDAFQSEYLKLWGAS